MSQGQTAEDHSSGDSALKEGGASSGTFRTPVTPSRAPANTRTKPP